MNKLETMWYMDDIHALIKEACIIDAPISVLVEVFNEYNITCVDEEVRLFSTKI